ncbi:MAG: yhdN [Gammaproteobacteria bacterium]|jgi:aryl-alcohol dehydrogenase-like predicted oxidoreductase|nr:yhdN [Gammaproteobacteria bacterium]
MGSIATMMKQVLLGNTGIFVSRVGLGTVKLGRNQKINYPTPFSLPKDKEILTLLDCAKELGINVLDTAPAYGTSEERLGKLIKGQRHHWVLCTKVGEEFIKGESYFDFSSSNLRHSIERSLKRLNTDYLDIVLVHSNGEDKKIIEEDGVFLTLADIKKSGLIRSFGMSTKTVEGGILAIDHSDIIMVTYNPTYTVEQTVIAYAQKKNKGVFIKKALASGHLQKIASDDPVKAAMQFIFREPGVSSVIVGTLNTTHLEYNIKCAEQAMG